MRATLTIDPAEDNRDEVHDMVDRLFGADPAGATEVEETPKEKKARAKAAKDAEKVEADDAPTHTRDEVRAKLKEYAALEGKEAAIKILKDHGAASIGELDKAQFDAVVKATGD